jgi:RND family efflux transporter MFP subunit
MHSLRNIFHLLIILVSMPAFSGELESITVEYADVGQEYIFDGVVEAVQEATLSAQTTGRVVEVLFDVDDFVRQDDIVVRLRDTQQIASLNKAEAAMSEARVRQQHADAEFKRASSIYERKLISRAQFDAAKTELNAARARLSATKAELERAREEVERTIIRAPYAGIVVERYIEIGEIAQPGTPVMRGVGLNQLRLSINVPQRLINAVRKLEQATVILETSEGERLIPAGNLTFFPYADERSRTFKVRVDLPEDTRGLFPGMFVKVAFVTAENLQLLVPQKSVVQRSEVSGVYVIAADGKISFRYIRPGKISRDGKRVVLAGLQEGEVVALDPLAAVTLLKAGTSGNE